jgi:hypothetical protein
VELLRQGVSRTQRVLETLSRQGKFGQVHRRRAGSSQNPNPFVINACVSLLGSSNDPPATPFGSSNRKTDVLRIGPDSPSVLQVTCHGVFFAALPCCLPRVQRSFAHGNREGSPPVQAGREDDPNRYWKSQRVGRLATVAADGQPRVVIYSPQTRSARRPSGCVLARARAGLCLAAGAPNAA